MRIYVVVGVYQGVVNEVMGFVDPGEAETELARLRGEYGIMPGQEEESESDAQLHEVDVETPPASVRVRRQVW